MLYLSSTKDPQHTVGFAEAVLKGLAPNGGLYVPEKISRLPDSFFVEMKNLSFSEIAFKVAQCFLDGAIPNEDLRTIINDSFNFEVPLVPVCENVHALELFHGPTMAFKDFGARFLARVVSYLNKASEKVTVLVATSGDTGSAVAQGFFGLPGVQVVLLYPSGKVSKIQEQQLTTLGGNVTALEVRGTFDDCQRMVKEAFGDGELSEKLGLTSANSINIARLLPQMFYYFYAASRLDYKRPLVFSVPSGNFGNLTAGLYANKMGLPIKAMIASTNSNNAVPEYLQSGSYSPKPTVSTISNAMDVGSPNNFDRIVHFFDKDHSAVKKMVKGYWFGDDETKKIIKQVHNQYGYLLDPHAAVSFLGLHTFMQRTNEVNGVFLGTAHPAKFKDVVEEAAGVTIHLPDALADCMNKSKQSLLINKGVDELKRILTASI